MQTEPHKNPKRRFKVRLATPEDKKEAVKKLGFQVADMIVSFRSVLAHIEDEQKKAKHAHDESIVSTVEKLANQLNEIVTTIEPDLDNISVGASTLSTIKPEALFRVRSAFFKLLNKDIADPKSLPDELAAAMKKDDHKAEKATDPNKTYIGEHMRCKIKDEDLQGTIDRLQKASMDIAKLSLSKLYLGSRDKLQQLLESDKALEKEALIKEEEERQAAKKANWEKTATFIGFHKKRTSYIAALKRFEATKNQAKGFNPPLTVAQTGIRDIENQMRSVSKMHDVTTRYFKDLGIQGVKKTDYSENIAIAQSFDSEQIDHLKHQASLMSKVERMIGRLSDTIYRSKKREQYYKNLANSSLEEIKTTKGIFEKFPTADQTQLPDEAKAVFKRIIDEQKGKIEELTTKINEALSKSNDLNDIESKIEILNPISREISSSLSYLERIQARLKAYTQMCQNPPNKVEKARSPYYSYETKRQSYYSNKKYSVTRYRPEYGICSRYSQDSRGHRIPLFMYEGKKLKYLRSTSQSKPLEFHSISLPRDFDPKLFNLQVGDFCDDMGNKLPEEMAKFASDAFTQVVTGIKMLPSPTEPTGLRAPSEKNKNGNGENKKLEPRHWGQRYLAELKPDVPPMLGQLLGSGGSYKAYRFGDKTIVEFDEEAHATYLFDTDYFNSLRAWSRGMLLKEKPAGFYGTINHPKKGGNRNGWKRRVNEFLGK